MNMKIFSGGNKPLTEQICEELGVTMDDVYHHTFPSGEKFCQFKTNIRGDDVFLIQGVDGNESANDSLMRLLVMADAAKRSSAARITAVMPMSFYSRQDRKTASRVPISAKLAANLIQAAGINRVLTMDIHAPQIQGFYDIPFDCLEFQPVLMEYLKSFIDMNNAIVVSPDIGAVKRSEKYAKSLKTGMALIAKIRKNDTEVELEHFIGDVKDKDCIIVDDLTESAGTLVQAAKACKDRGAKSVTCAVTHNCITEVGMNRLIENMYHPNVLKEIVIDRFIHSDTINKWWHLKYKPATIIQLNVGKLFGKAIRNIHENKSVNELIEIK